jgi:hypothetical protein
MRHTLKFLAMGMLIAVMTCGCAATRAQRVGFLSDYSKLKPQSDVSYRYLAPGNPLANYSKFIIEPVVVHLHVSSEGKGKISNDDLGDLKNYMHDALVNAIKDRYQVVYRAGPGVARVRVALTDLKKANVLMNVHPASKLIGSGLGGASLEAELVDSQSGQQIAALMESQLGERLSLDGLSEWGDAQAIMDGWAERFRQRLDEAN